MDLQERTLPCEEKGAWLCVDKWILGTSDAPKQFTRTSRSMLNTSDKRIYHLQPSDKSYHADCLSALFRDKNREATICLHPAVLCRCLPPLNKYLAGCASHIQHLNPYLTTRDLETLLFHLHVILSSLA